MINKIVPTGERDAVEITNNLAYDASVPAVLHIAGSEAGRDEARGCKEVWAAALSGGCEIDPFILHNHW